MDKPALRKKLRDHRRGMSEGRQKQAKKALADIVCRLPFFLHSQRIAIYLASDGEINPAGIIKKSWEMGKQCYLPILLQDQKGFLAFLPYAPDTPLELNRFNIPEPTFHANQILPPEELDTVFMPLTGFDENGHRLGMGGGYYDRTFAFTRTHPEPSLIGLAHECQKTDSIPANEWDIPMTGIATDQHYYSCRP
ncbi:5-formyltetrahydrofolate cyclo-ligase [invertebrate metagenome]|uniref:5-formyltetrahydrofolate cyclo-ligase n=1 Tax=invertebrate metagenome TaxID=1711999 RepID=A0A2H9TBK6_9ZZZZ